MPASPPWPARQASARATVRRALAAVELADDIELGYYDDLVTDDVDAVFLAADDESDDADDEGQA